MLSFDYDRDADALAIRLGGGIVVRTVDIDAGTLVDLDAQGGLVAIEVIQPRRPWPLDEILNEYDVPEDAEAVLRSLWEGNKPYPFAEPLALA
jgi:uncharacterized protein YuzE